MGKVVLSSEDEREDKITGEGGGGLMSDCSSSIVRWERFLPKMVLKVLLVEADHSTRQIIAALLRKCSYKVAAVSDGLEAWEVLKGRPKNIDLILTEVELPSISGYALLTLIMEHDACKNIPVIMMSSQDSISTVYKCMLRGAADFLVKPVRKNELKNLWQHFWRKQASTSAALELLDESVAQQKAEATAENKAHGNRSSGSMACILRNREDIGKGSDAQSSCTKPESDSEKTNIERIHCLRHEITQQISNELHIPTKEECHQESLKTKGQGNQAVGNILTGLDQVNVSSSNSAKNRIPENYSKEAIDLIGTFGNYQISAGSVPFGGSASNASIKKFDSLLHLDLCLKRSNTSDQGNKVNDEHRLNHSDVSAFHRYTGKQLYTSPSTCNRKKDHEINADKKCPSNSDHSFVAVIQPEPSETTVPCSQKKEKNLAISVKGVRFENVINACDFETPCPAAPEHSDFIYQMNRLCPLDRPSSSSQEVNNLVDQRIDDAHDDMKQTQKLEVFNDVVNLSSANDQSANTSLCIGNTVNPPINEVSAVKVMPEYGNEKGLHVYEGSSHRSIQREAALTKFRLKRTDRCFEKKVRYESRKKLAEQRPRVKGQFVRQVPNHDPQPADFRLVRHS